MFHTHPPTPKPGGRRVYGGILYEFPSVSDVFHFMDHFNSGNIQGSLVVTPEGLYNIRKKDFNKNKIKVNSSNLYDKLKKVIYSVQEDAIDKYGMDFSVSVSYLRIAQDTKWINQINKTLNEFHMHIDYFPRSHNKGKWIMESVDLPVFIQSKMMKQK